MNTIKRSFAQCDSEDYVVVQQKKRQQNNPQSFDLSDTIMIDSLPDNSPKLPTCSADKEDVEDLVTHLKVESSDTTSLRCSAESANLTMKNLLSNETSIPMITLDDTRTQHTKESDLLTTRWNPLSKYVDELRELSTQAQQLELQREVHSKRAELAGQRINAGEQALGQMLRNLIALQRGIETKRQQIAGEKACFEEQSRLAGQIAQRIQVRRGECDVALAKMAANMDSRTLENISH